MKKLLVSFLFSMLATNPLLAMTPNEAGTISTDGTLIRTLVGTEGRYNSLEQVYKITVPRTDLNITINGIKIAPAMGLTSWVTFKKLDDAKTLLKGNLVLTEDQINTVMQAVIDNHLNVTELHNHLMWESPKVMFMHIEGMGSTQVLAMEMNKVFEAMKLTSDGQGDFPLGEIDATNTTFDQQSIADILGARGVIQDGVYRVVIDRVAKNTMTDFGVTLRTNAKATFAGSNEAAVIDGDLAMQQPNLQKVLTALHKAGISIVAIHQRPINDKVTYVFLHYWGIGKPTELARGLRRALDISQSINEMPTVTANRLLRNALRASYYYVPPVRAITILSNYCHVNFCSSTQKLLMRQNVS
ncbi:MAG: DUF1259 domain-containing protein [Pseudomonadota bacterium]